MKSIPIIIVTLLAYSCSVDPDIPVPPPSAIDWLPSTPPAMTYVGGIAVGTDGGLFAWNESVFTRSKDHGATWTPLILNVPGIRAMAIDSAGAVYLVRDDTLFSSPDEGSTWTIVAPLDTNLDPGGLVIHRNGYLYLISWDSRLYRSTDGGTSFQYLLSGFRSSLGPVFIAPWDDMYVPVTNSLGTACAVYRSTDYGDSWVSPPFSFAFPFASYAVTDSGVMLAGTVSHSYAGGFLLRSTDRGTTWTEIEGPWRRAHVRGVVVNSAGTLLVGTSRDVNDGVDGIFGLSEGDSSWSPFNAGLPDTRVLRLIRDRGDYLYCVLTDGRMYRTREPGTDAIAPGTRRPRR